MNNVRWFSPHSILDKMYSQERIVGQIRFLFLHGFILMPLYKKLKSTRISNILTKRIIEASQVVYWSPRPRNDPVWVWMSRWFSWLISWIIFCSVQTYFEICQISKPCLCKQLDRVPIGCKIICHLLIDLPKKFADMRARQLNEFILVWNRWTTVTHSDWFLTISTFHPLPGWLISFPSLFQ